jgi:hypothetical protein
VAAERKLCTGMAFAKAFLIIYPNKTDMVQLFRIAAQNESLTLGLQEVMSIFAKLLFDDTLPECFTYMMDKEVFE